MTENIKIECQLVEGGKLPLKAHYNDACFDLWTSKNQNSIDGNWEVKGSEIALIGLGVKMNLSDDLEVNIYPRSSTILSFGLIPASSISVIDPGTREEMKFSALNSVPFKVLKKNNQNSVENNSFLVDILETCQVIKQGSKIAQLKILKYCPDIGGKIDVTNRVEFIEVKDFTDFYNIREGGFGSTGRE